MSDEFNEFMNAEDDNTGEPPDSTGPKALREALKREKEKREELEQWKAAKEAEERRTKLAETLNAAGVNPLVAELIPDSVKEDGVADWLVKYKDALGPAAPAGDEGPPAPKLSEQEQADLAAVSGAPEGTVAPVPDEYLANLSKAENKNDFYARVNAWASNPTGAGSP